MRPTIAILALLLAAGAPRASLRAQARPVRITADSIGTIPTAATLAEIARRVPESRQVARGGGGSDISYPALTFDLPGLHLWAVQALEVPERMDTVPDVDRTRPADFFAIEGAGGILPGGATTGSTWERIRRALGPVVVYGEPGTPFHVRPCRYDWLTVAFENRGDRRPRSDDTVAPTTIPAKARPLYVQVNPRDRGGSSHPRCRAASRGT